MKYKCILIIMLFSLLINSCSDDSATSAEANSFAGKWEVNAYGYTTSTEIKVDNNGMRFLDTYYSGYYDGNSFSGTYNHDSNTKFKLYITLSGNRIYGTIRTSISTGSKTYSETEDFTGRKQ